MRKTKKLKYKLIGLILLFLLALYCLGRFQPQLWQKYSRDFMAYSQNYIKLPEETQVLGAKTVKLLENKSKQGADFVFSLPIIKKYQQDIKNNLQNEFNKILTKPQQEAEKIKLDVRDTVCENWLAE